MKKRGPHELRDKVLAAFPGTRIELNQKAGVSASTVGKWLAILRAENVVHIDRWERPKRAVYVLGPGVDAVKPPALTPTEKSRIFNQRYPQRREEIRAKYLGRLRYERSKRKSTTWFAALVFQPSQRY